jgi:hypothetical protein
LWQGAELGQRQPQSDTTVHQIPITEWHHIITVKAVLHLLLDGQMPPQSIHLLVLEVEGHEALVCMALHQPTVAVMEDS